MTTDEIQAGLMAHPVLTAYVALLFAGSLVSFIILIRKLMKLHRLGPNPIPPWSLGFTDFALFVVSIFIWFLVSGAILLQVYSWIAGEAAEPGSRVMVIGGFLFQSGLLYLFLRFRFHYRSPNEGPLSPRILSMGQAFSLGLFYFLACLPIIYGIGTCWTSVLDYIRELGWEIDLPLQDAVLLLQTSDDPFSFIGLFLLAVVVAPVVEESVFRGGVYRFFKGKTSIALALVISGTLFGIIHGNLQSLPGLVTVGVCLGLTYELSGSLKVPIFFHAFFNLNSVIFILLTSDGMAG